MSDDEHPPQVNIEQEKIELERYKAQLDYKKFVLGSVFVALAIAAIPPSFQLATAALEYVKSNAERQAKQQAFRDDYIKEFISNALNQDIELRIRFAQYFARVSTEPFRDDWLAYFNDLKGVRSEIRTQIDKMEAEWRLKAQAEQRDEADIERLERNLAWAYKEVGYVERNRSAASNPRAPEPGGQQTGPLDDFFRGVERSSAKLSVGSRTTESFSDLKDLITSLPPENTMSSHIPPITRDADSPRVAEEQRNVKVRAFLFAASRQVSNDYHLVIGRAPTTQPKMYMTAIISGLPPADQPAYAKLKAVRDGFKAFFGSNLPGPSYSFYDPPIPIEIEGSLFFNVVNVGGRQIGPASLRRDVKTIWEIRPITKFLTEP